MRLVVAILVCGLALLLLLSQPSVVSADETWENSETTTLLWTVCATHNIANLKEILANYPGAIHLRSADGRGVLWWAYEFGFTEAIELLESAGIDVNARDSDGLTAADMLKHQSQPIVQQTNTIVDDDEDDAGDYLDFFDDDEDDMDDDEEY